MNELNSRQLAESILSNTTYKNSLEETERLAEQISFLENVGLSELNKILANNSKGSLRNFRDFIAEHNFGTDLVKHNGLTTVIEYEPNRFNRPPDFVSEKGGVSFYVQMKALSSGERDNRRVKLHNKLKQELQKINYGKFISIDLAEDFSELDMTNLIAEIREKLGTYKDNQDYFFPAEELDDASQGEQQFLLGLIEPKARITFHQPNMQVLSNLTLVSTGDLRMIELTGEVEAQIKNSLVKAIGAFEWNSNISHINLIAMEADRYDDTDISEALFGTSVHIKSSSFHGVRRDPNGFFGDTKHIQKVCGVIALRRNDSTLISSYRKTLFINPNYESIVDTIGNFVDIDEVITYTQLP
ncbi:hypothetical protein [Paenibacillus amylolyticus]|uniref:hypothetical protein n=1 Tax=Paenibacillus amylolyticus TaxID=1451 RepID=UPI0033954F14